MNEHEYADLFMAMADNKTIEGRYQGGIWGHVERPWMLLSNPEWELRVKVPTILINGIEVTEPVRRPLQVGQEYWLVRIEKEELITRHLWHNDHLDNLFLERGLIQLTRKDATIQANAMLSLCENNLGCN